MPAGKKYIEELWVGIRADLTHLQRGLAISKTEAKSFAGQLGAMSTQLRSFGKSVSIVSGIILGMGAIATKVFADFQQSMANTQSVLGGTQEQFQKLSDYAREMGKTTVFTASQAADAMYYLASAGYNTEKVIDALQGTLNLAAATQYDLAETTRIVVSTINAFGMAASEADRVANAFSAVISASQATMYRLGHSMKYVAPVAAALEIPFEQVTAALGTLYNAGLEASQAGVYLRGGLIRLQKPTRQAKDAMAALGLSVQDLSPQTKNLVEIIRTLEKAEAGAKDKGDELAAIFGTRALTAFQILIRQGADEIYNLQQRITGTTKAYSMAEIQINTLKGAFRLLVSAVQEAAIQIGEILAPAVRWLIDVVRDAVMIFNELPKVLKVIMVVIPTIAAAFGMILGPISLLLSMIPKLAVALGTLKTVMVGALGPIGLLTVAIAAVVAGIALWISAERRQRESMEKNLKTIGELVDKRIDEARNVASLVNEYKKLATEEDRTAEQNQRMNEIVESLNSIYPSLNLESGKYAENLKKIETASEGANEELARLLELKKTIEEIKVTLEISDLNKQIREMKDDIQGGADLWDKTFGQLIIRLDKTELTKGIETFNELKSIAAEDIVVPSEDWVEDFIGGVKKADRAVETLNLRSSDVVNTLSQMVTTEEGVAKITRDVAIFTDLIAQKSVRINEIRAEALEDGRDLTNEEEMRISELERQAKHYSNISNIYTSILGKTAELKTTEFDLEEALKKRKKLMEGIEEKTGQKPEAVTPAGDDAENEKRRQEMILELEKQTLNARMAMNKLVSAKNLEDALKTIEQEYGYKEKMLNKEKELAIDKAEEIGLATAEVDQAFAIEAELLEAEKQKKINDVKEKYRKKDDEKVAARLEYEAELDEDNLGKYREYLEKKLKAAEEWSDEYIRILNLIHQIDEENRRKRERAAQAEASFMADVASAIGKTLGQSAAGIEDAWKSGLKSVISMFKNYYRNMLLMGAAADIAMQNYAGAAQKAVTIGIIEAIAAAAMAAIDSAEIGAKVTESGVVRVHKGEEIVPARIVRQSEREYKSTMDRALGVEDKMFDVAKPTINIYYPLVSDQDFWETVVEDYLIQAWDNVDKRMK